MIFYDFYFIGSIVLAILIIYLVIVFDDIFAEKMLKRRRAIYANIPTGLDEVKTPKPEMRDWYIALRENIVAHPDKWQAEYNKLINNSLDITITLASPEFYSAFIGEPLDANRIDFNTTENSDIVKLYNTIKEKNDNKHMQYLKIKLNSKK